MRTLLKLSAFVSIIILIAMGCQKTLTNEDLLTDAASTVKGFNTARVQEWYFGTFQKSAEWKGSSLQGKKIPDWKSGVYHKVGNIEIVEFPLLKEKTKISIPSNNSLTPAEKQKIANASLTKVLFIKNAKGNITVREVDYIPDWQYLQKKQFDISKVSYGKLGDDFTGKMVLKKWDGTILSRKLLSNGKISKNGKVKKLEINTQSQETNSTNLQECTAVTYCVFETFCEFTLIGDSWVIVCSEPTNTGDCWVEEYCGEVNCGIMTEEQCLCMLYEIGCTAGGGEEEEQCSTALNDLAGSASVSNEIISITNVTSNSTTRTKNYEWKILTSWGGWYIFSFDQGIHEKDINNSANPWKWQSFNHNDISLVGIVVGGTAEPSLISATPTIGIYNAVMEVKFKVKYSVICSISPINYTLTYTSSKLFNVNN
jgi:hypothetical protein